MRLTDLLSVERVAVRRRDGGGDPSSSPRTLDKHEALLLLSEMLAVAAHVSPEVVAKVLEERESLQSTGIGDGVAIPHGALAELDRQWAALLIVPDGLEFDAIDGVKANLLFAVLGPKRATGEHLKTLARVSRLLRNKAFRDDLTHAHGPKAAFELLVSEENEHP